MGEIKTNSFAKILPIDFLEIANSCDLMNIDNFIYQV